MIDKLVSIIIPCKQIDTYTKECIAECKKLDYANIEIILLPDEENERFPLVKTIVTGSVSPGRKRNIGVKNSQGEFCAFIDNDAQPRKDWLKAALSYFDDPNVGGVGGPGLTPQSDSFMQKAGGFVMSSFMVGNLASRYSEKSCFESDDIHSCNFIARKSVIEQAGGWSEKYWPGEDTLMCLAIKKIGKKLIESSEVIVFHHRRSLFKAHVAQVSRFGEHRGFFAKKFPENSLKISYFFPSLLILALIVGAALPFLFPFFSYVSISLVLVYGLLCLAASISQVHNIKMAMAVWLGIIVTHIVYGSFFISGLVKGDLKR